MSRLFFGGVELRPAALPGEYWSVPGGGVLTLEDLIVRAAEHGVSLVRAEPEGKGVTMTLLTGD